LSGAAGRLTGLQIKDKLSTTAKVAAALSGAKLPAAAMTARPTASSTSIPAPSESWRSELAQILNDWRIDLMRAHPRLFEVMSDEPERSCGYPLCEAGWRDILERLCIRIEAALAEGGGWLRVLQIQEKYGSTSGFMTAIRCRPKVLVAAMIDSILKPWKLASATARLHPARSVEGELHPHLFRRPSMIHLGWRPWIQRTQLEKSGRTVKPSEQVHRVQVARSSSTMANRKRTDPSQPVVSGVPVSPKH
jgi:hypothetical protein